MQNPEVWNFPAPKSKYKERIGNFVAEETDIPREINEFYFNHLVSVVIPDTVGVPEDIRDALSNDCEYYRIEQLPLSEIIEKKFIDSFIKKGHLTLLSVDTKIDVDDCVCVTPDGYLVLSLNKKVYEELGVEGKVSHFAVKTKERYIIRLDIKSETFTATKLYERTLQALGERLQKFNVIISWDPHQNNVCPSSVAKYLVFRGYKIKTSTPQCQSRTKFQVKVPEVESCEAGEIVEWLGMFAISGEIGRIDSFTNTYEVPEPNTQIGQVRYLEWRGLFTTRMIARLYNQLKLFASRNSNIPWASLYVQGFSDSPVAWGLQEHHYFTNGDNAYVIFLQPSGRYLLCTQKCTNKRND